jgi:hypothetical protein
MASSSHHCGNCCGPSSVVADTSGIYREQDVKHLLSMDEAFLQFLDKMDEQAKLERAQNAKLIEHQPATDMKSPEPALQPPQKRSAGFASYRSQLRSSSRITSGSGIAGAE